MSDDTGTAPGRARGDGSSVPGAAGILSIDAMGSDLGPEAVVSGLAAAVKRLLPCASSFTATAPCSSR